MHFGAEMFMITFISSPVPEFTCIAIHFGAELFSIKVTCRKFKMFAPYFTGGWKYSEVILLLHVPTRSNLHYGGFPLPRLNTTDRQSLYVLTIMITVAISAVWFSANVVKCLRGVLLLKTPNIAHGDYHDFDYNVNSVTVARVGTITMTPDSLSAV